MKKTSYKLFTTALFLACTATICLQAQSQNYSAYSSPASSPDSATNRAIRFGIVNAKKCLEKSKLGKAEQASFENMKKQRETSLKQKESLLQEIERQIEDNEELNDIADDSLVELKRKRRAIRNEGMQLQNQYMQELQEANMKIVQKLTDSISKASAQVAQESSSSSTPLEAIFTDEACTFYAPMLDVSDKIIAKMDAIFDAEEQNSKARS
jgi:outer membrane protein